MSGVELANVNWQRVFMNIRSAGMSVAATARRIGMDDRTAQRYARGECALGPRWEQAVRLLDLHHAICPERHTLDGLSAP